MMELVDITDLKSVGCNGRAGSSPAASTNRRNEGKPGNGAECTSKESPRG